MDRKSYEEDLKRRQEEHLRQVQGGGLGEPFVPCLHEQCPECIGTGVRRDGSACIHCISCPCPKCTPRCGTAGAPQQYNGHGTYTARWSDTSEQEANDVKVQNLGTL